MQTGDRAAAEADGGALDDTTGQPDGHLVLRFAWGHLEALLGRLPQLTTDFHERTRKRNLPTFHLAASREQFTIAILRHFRLPGITAVAAPGWAEEAFR